MQPSAHLGLWWGLTLYATKHVFSQLTVQSMLYGFGCSVWRLGFRVRGVGSKTANQTAAEPPAGLRAMQVRARAFTGGAVRRYMCCALDACRWFSFYVVGCLCLFLLLCVCVRFLAASDLLQAF